MITIKVFHQSDKNTFRRFVISNKATWSELEAKIRSLFSISASTPFILSYVDEDNDVITLSTDTELQEVLSSREPTSTIKFNLKISALDNLSDSEDSNNEAWVFEGSPQRTASVDTPDNKENDNDDDVPQKNITSTTNQEAQSVESDSGEVGEVSSNKRLLLDDDLYEEGTSSTKKNSMNEFYKSFDALGFVPTITPLNEDKGKQKEPIGESSSINVSSSLSSSSSSLLEQNQKSPQEHQNNQPPQEDQNNSPPSSPALQGQNNQPTLSVYELADNFQKLIDKFQEEAENNPKYAKDSLSKLHQLIRSISAQLPPLEEEYQSQDNQRDQRYNVQQQSHSQSRRNNDDFFDNPPPLFIRQPPIPGSFPTPPKSVPCPWASQARPDSESYEPHHHTKNGRRRRRRHRRHHHNRDYDRHEPKEETQEPQEEREEEILEHEEMLEAQERMREEMQERAQEGREEEPELRDVRELRKANELSPYQEQIDILNNMGFWPDEDQYVELLTMYEGNIEQVVECLLERQSRSQ